ncbi:MAG: phosphatase PAP2 family protein [Sulfurimonas sp.]|nr:phosphatase PAP2 family protein [Sulfurimonas sp.]MBU1217802.1 phosphatase PAP2 family protein [bacterium]MBU1433399.1 phosphatase PAP2 family protein [bacterium]MBU1503405.1 phosphatase PAP2 family protein [bacterium]MBU3940021.1 phosphatase PAP2 family protein [bacterium]
MNKKILHVPLTIWLLFVVSSLVFVFFPQIDIFISNLFYDGKGFPINGTLFEEVFYYSVKPLIIAFSLGALLIFLYNFFSKKNLFNINAKVILYLLLTLGLAPGLIVNSVLKENWERARPAQTTQFGGDKEFSPAFIVSDQEGYSFSSGHAAGAFSLLAFALLLKRQRTFWISVALIYGVLVSFARVSAGGHFLSDVVTSFFLVTIFTIIFYSWLMKEKNENV